MTRSEIRDIVIQALAEVAPEVDAATVRDDVPLRQQIDLDSMDFLRFVIALHQHTGVEVAEADYGRLDTAADVVDYIATRAPGQAPTTAPGSTPA